MANFGAARWKESFVLFERAAAKVHEESIWIVSVMKDMDMEESDIKEAFAKSEEPLGWHLAGRLSESTEVFYDLYNSPEVFDFYKMSAEGGCSWGQAAYANHFEEGHLVEKDEDV
jgi:hypothetical protein